MCPGCNYWGARVSSLSAGAGPGGGSGRTQWRTRSGRPNANDEIWNQFERRKVCGLLGWTHWFDLKSACLWLNFSFVYLFIFSFFFFKVPRRLSTPGWGVWLLLLQEPPEGVPSPPALDQWAAGRCPPHGPQHGALPWLLRRPERSPGGGSARPPEETRSVGTRQEIRPKLERRRRLFDLLLSRKNPQNWIGLRAKALGLGWFVRRWTLIPQYWVWCTLWKFKRV